MADADYKKIYFIPALETRLAFVNLNIKSQDTLIQREVQKELILLRREITKELNFVGKKDFAQLEDFTPERFDSSVYDETTYFLTTLKRFYINRYNKADEEKDKRISELTNSPEKEKSFEEFRNQYQNEAISELVKNTIEQNRIIEKNGKLIQKIFPIYKNPDPEHLVDFDAQFYMPTKHILNQSIDTLYFNLGVIWAMTFLLAITLYFDILRKIIDGLGNISNPLPKRM
jgi:hypothetical protein